MSRFCFETEQIAGFQMPHFSGTAFQNPPDQKHPSPRIDGRQQTLLMQPARQRMDADGEVLRPGHLLCYLVARVRVEKDFASREPADSAPLQ